MMKPLLSGKKPGSYDACAGMSTPRCRSVTAAPALVSPPLPTNRPSADDRIQYEVRPSSSRRIRIAPAISQPPPYGLLPARGRLPRHCDGSDAPPQPYMLRPRELLTARQPWVAIADTCDCRSLEIDG